MRELLKTRVNARRGVMAVAVAVALLVAPAWASAERLTADILPFYNHDRQLNGLPTVSVVNQAMQQGCYNHDHYMALNHEEVHGEDPSKPGYTPQGNYQDGAQGGEVLAEDTGWTGTYEPWKNAPLHLFFLFDPSVYQVGYADREGYQCLRMRGPDTAMPGDGAPTAPTFYAWTSDTGRQNVPPSEHAGEWPYTPQQLVGLPASKTTGPNILLFSAGDLGTPESATLSGPQGAVNTALINYNTQNSVGDGKWFYGGGVLLPVNPLKPHATYTATVNWNDQDANEVQQFSFTTGAQVVQTTISLRLRSDRKGRLRVSVAGTPHAAVSLSRKGHQTRRPRLSHGHTGWLKLPLGLWQVCAASVDPTHPATPVCQAIDLEIPAAVQ